MLIKPVWILLENEVQDKIGHVDFGRYSAMFSLSYLFLVFSDLGVNQYLTKTLAADPDQVRSFFPNALALKIILSVFYPLLVLGSAYLVGYSQADLQLLGSLAIVQALLQLGTLFRSKIQAFQYFAVDSLASIVERIVLMVLVLLAIKEISLEVFVLDRLWAAGINLVVIVGITWYLFGRVKPAFDLSAYKGILNKSLPFGLIAVFISVHEKIDQVILERMAGAEATGIYVAAYRWVDACMMYLWLMMPVFFARFAYLHQEKEELNKLFSFAQTVALLPIIVICGFVFVYGEKFFFMFDQSTVEEIGVMTTCLKILFISVLASGFFLVYGTYLSATGSEKFINKMLILSVLLNMLVNVLLIPMYKEIGAAIATVVSATFMNASYFIRMWLKREVQIPLRTLWWSLGATCIYLIVLFLLKGLGMHWILSSALAVALFILIVFYAGIVRFADLKSLLKKNS